MTLAALVSGGKDGLFAAYIAKQTGHDVSCMITISPHNDESMLWHHPNTRHVSLQAQSMRMPVIHVRSGPDDESASLQDALGRAKTEYGIDGIVHGGIRSAYQRDMFADICQRDSLDVMAPLWGYEDETYLNLLVSSGFKVIVTSVSADGLDESWLGAEITCESVKRLVQLSVKYGFNASLEGGEGETFVTDCPLFERRIVVEKSATVWDGYRGRFEIEEASLAKPC